MRWSPGRARLCALSLCVPHAVCAPCWGTACVPPFTLLPCLGGRHSLPRGAGLLRSPERPRRGTWWGWGWGLFQGLEKQRILKRPQVSVLKEVGILGQNKVGERRKICKACVRCQAQFWCLQSLPAGAQVAPRDLPHRGTPQQCSGTLCGLSQSVIKTWSPTAPWYPTVPWGHSSHQILVLEALALGGHLGRPGA